MISLRDLTIFRMSLMIKGFTIATRMANYRHQDCLQRYRLHHLRRCRK